VTADGDARCSTFLGAAHIGQVELERIRASKAFHRVDVSSQLAFLQVCADPADALRPDFESSLDAARTALRPLLMDLSDVKPD
jgi:hypothetical protein